MFNLSKLSDSDYAAARLVWDYLTIEDRLEPSDAILCLGSFDLNIARRAADIYFCGWADIVVVSGGVAHLDDLAATGWSRSEAEVLDEELQRFGVPCTAIIKECGASNTSQNFSHTRAMLKSLKIDARRIIVVAKPYMTRRARATARAVWADMNFLFTSESISFDQYIRRVDLDNQLGRVLHVLVGDFHRMLVYPEFGFQANEISPNMQTMEAFKFLISSGWSKHLVKGAPIND